MTLKRVHVNISHTFTVDIPDDLMEYYEGDSYDESPDALDDFLYEEFIDSDWYFNDLSIKDIVS